MVVANVKQDLLETVANARTSMNAQTRVLDVQLMLDAKILLGPMSVNVTTVLLEMDIAKGLIFLPYKNVFLQSLTLMFSTSFRLTVVPAWGFAFLGVENPILLLRKTCWL